MTLTGVYIKPEKSNAMCCNLWKGWETERDGVHPGAGGLGLLQARNTLPAQGMETDSWLREETQGCLGILLKF